MEKTWLKSYPPGVPAEVDVGQYRSLVDLLDESFTKFRDAPAYVCMGKNITFSQLDELSRALAAWFQEKGLKRGDRIAIMLPNILQFPVATAAVLRAGLILVNINPLYTPRELEHQVKDSGAVAIIVLENFAHTLEKVIDATPLKHVIVASMGDMLGFVKGAVVNAVVRRLRKMVPSYSLPGHVKFNAALKAGRRYRLRSVDIGPDDVAVLQYTGGTTGVSKGATLRHKTIVANLLSSEAWLQPGLKRKPISGQLTFVCALPLYHVYAFISCGLLGMRTGGLNVLISNPRDIPATIKEIAKFKFHILPGVNTLFNALLNNPNFAKLDFSELLISNGGSIAVQESVAKRWLLTTGCPIVEGYGLSETSSGVICNPTDSQSFTGTIGLPLPNVDVRILDDMDSELPLGESGEIAVKGPQVMSGYWNRPDDTEKVFTSDGFLKTGDIGLMDERGYVKMVDRKKDMIVVSGFKVYPNEVEDVVASCPGVLECAVVGVYDPSSGEAVKLFVVTKDSALNERQLLDFCRERLTAYKIPKSIEFRAELPKSIVGKILRRELREQGR